MSSFEQPLMASYHIKQYGNLDASVVPNGAKHLYVIGRRINITVLNMWHLGSIIPFWRSKE